MAEEKNKKKKTIDLQPLLGKKIEIVSKIFVDENGKPWETHFIGIFDRKELEYLRIKNARVYIANPFNPYSPQEIHEIGRYPTIAVRKELVAYVAEVE